MRDRKMIVVPSVILLVGLLYGAPSAQEDSKPRVYIEQSDSWEVTGGLGGTKGAIGGGSQGGARPQTAEVIKTFGKRCPFVIVTMRKERADYVVLLQHEGGKDVIKKDNKFAVFDDEGDAIASGSTRNLGNAVKDACVAISRDAREKGPAHKAVGQSR
ncbi:MAG TPA: hypothetical protein VKG02_25195 [Blastocatellia bacterium]|nr:hypothetical protein [Blastocatellia bacterium]HKE03057.1 hypothetical protein [Blastocatellia bacterium]